MDINGMKITELQFRDDLINFIREKLGINEVNEDDWHLDMDSGWLDSSPVTVKLVFPSELFEWDQEVRDRYSLYCYPECSICNRSEYNRTGMSQLFGDVCNSTKSLSYCDFCDEWTCTKYSPNYEDFHDYDEDSERHKHICNYCIEDKNK